MQQKIVLIYKCIISGVKEVVITSTRYKKHRIYRCHIEDLTSDEIISMYIAGVPFRELAAVYNDDKEKFARLTKPELLKLFQLGASLGDMNVMYNNDRAALDAFVLRVNLKNFQNLSINLMLT